MPDLNRISSMYENYIIGYNTLQNKKANLTLQDKEKGKIDARISEANRLVNDAQRKLDNAKRRRDNADKNLKSAQNRLTREQEIAAEKKRKIKRDYDSEIIRLKEEKQKKIHAEIQNVQNKYDEEEQGYQSIIESLKNVDDPATLDYFSYGIDSAELSEIDGKIQNFKHVLNDTAKDKKIAEIKNEIENTSIEQAKETKGKFSNRFEFINKCLQIQDLPQKLTEGGRLNLVENNNWNKYFIPGIIGLSIGAWLFFILLNMNMSSNLYTVEYTGGRMLFGGLLALIVALATLVSVSDGELVFAGPAAMIGIMIYDFFTSGVSIFSIRFIGGLFITCIMLAVVSLIYGFVASIDNVIVGLITTIIAGVRSYFWVLNDLDIHIPNWSYKLMYLLANGVARVLGPVLIAAAAFFIVRLALTKTKLGHYILFGEKKKYQEEVARLLTSYKDDYKMLCNFYAVIAEFRREELIDEYQGKINNLSKYVDTSEIEDGYRKKMSAFSDWKETEDRKVTNGLKIFRDQVTSYSGEVKSCSREMDSYEYELKKAKQERKKCPEAINIGKLKNEISDSKKKLAEMLEMDNAKLQQKMSSSAALIASKGNLNPYVYMVRNKRDVDKLPLIRKVPINCRPTICLYDSSEITTDNLSEEMIPFMRWFCNSVMNVNPQIILNKVAVIDTWSGSTVLKFPDYRALWAVADSLEQVNRGLVGMLENKKQRILNLWNNDEIREEADNLQERNKDNVDALNRVIMSINMKHDRDYLENTAIIRDGNMTYDFVKYNVLIFIMTEYKANAVRSNILNEDMKRILRETEMHGIMPLFMIDAQSWNISNPSDDIQYLKELNNKNIWEVTDIGKNREEELDINVIEG